MPCAQTLPVDRRDAQRMVFAAGGDGAGDARLSAAEYARRRARHLLLHLRDDQRAEGRATRTCLHMGASVHRFAVVGIEAGRSALDDFGHGLGEGRVWRAFRTLDERHYDFHVQRALRSKAAARAAQPLSHHDLLRAADRIPDAGEGGSRESSAAGVAPLRGRGRAAQS